MNKKFLILLGSIAAIFLILVIGAKIAGTTSDSGMQDVIIAGEALTMGNFETTIKTSGDIFSLNTSGSKTKIPDTVSIKIKGTTDGVRTIANVNLDFDFMQIDMRELVFIDGETAYINMDALSKLYGKGTVEQLDANAGKWLPINIKCSDGSTIINGVKGFISEIRNIIITNSQYTTNDEIYSIKFENNEIIQICQIIADSITQNPEKWNQLFNKPTSTTKNETMTEIETATEGETIIENETEKKTEVKVKNESVTKTDTITEDKTTVKIDVASAEDIVTFINNFLNKIQTSNLSYKYSHSISYSTTDEKVFFQTLSLKSESEDGETAAISISHKFTENTNLSIESLSTDKVIPQSDSDSVLSALILGFSKINMFTPIYTEVETDKFKISTNDIGVICSEKNDLFTNKIIYVTSSGVVADIYAIVNTKDDDVAAAFKQYYESREYDVLDDTFIEYNKTELSDVSITAYNYIMKKLNADGQSTIFRARDSVVKKYSSKIATEDALLKLLTDEEGEGF